MDIPSPFVLSQRFCCVTCVLLSCGLSCLLLIKFSISDGGGPDGKTVSPAVRSATAARNEQLCKRVTTRADSDLYTLTVNDI